MKATCNNERQSTALSFIGNYTKTCAANEFSCKTTTKCVNNKFLCDQGNDCGDESDEICAENAPRPLNREFSIPFWIYLQIVGYRQTMHLPSDCVVIEIFSWNFAPCIAFDQTVDLYHIISKNCHQKISTKHTPVTSFTNIIAVPNLK